jgi:hypothetical protein
VAGPFKCGGLIVTSGACDGVNVENNSVSVFDIVIDSDGRELKDNDELLFVVVVFDVVNAFCGKIELAVCVNNNIG